MVDGIGRGRMVFRSVNAPKPHLGMWRSFAAARTVMCGGPQLCPAANHRGHDATSGDGKYRCEYV